MQFEIINLRCPLTIDLFVKGIVKAAIYSVQERFHNCKGNVGNHARNKILFQDDTFQ
jgi:hypothetical protein